jgi:hypothetical protein
MSFLAWVKTETNMPFSINKKYFWQIANSASGASIGFAFLWLLRRFAGVFYPDFCRKNTLNAPDFKEKSRCQD